MIEPKRKKLNNINSFKFKFTKDYIAFGLVLAVQERVNKFINWEGTYRPF